MEEQILKTTPPEGIPPTNALNARVPSLAGLVALRGRRRGCLRVVDFREVDGLKLATQLFHLHFQRAHLFPHFAVELRPAGIRQVQNNRPACDKA